MCPQIRNFKQIVGRKKAIWYLQLHLQKQAEYFHSHFWIFLFIHLWVFFLILIHLTLLISLLFVSYSGHILQCFLFLFPSFLSLFISHSDPLLPLPSSSSSPKLHYSFSLFILKAFTLWSQNIFLCFSCIVILYFCYLTGAFYPYSPQFSWFNSFSS